MIDISLIIILLISNNSPEILSKAFDINYSTGKEGKRIQEIFNDISKLTNSRIYITKDIPSYNKTMEISVNGNYTRSDVIKIIIKNFKNLFILSDYDHKGSVPVYIITNRKPKIFIE